jgi:DNA-binding transcriptional MocR family regulator
MATWQALKDPDQRKLYRHVIYLVPSCSNPGGTSMPVSGRTALVHLARKHNSLVICDDVYDFLQWPVLPTTPGDGDAVAPGPLLPRLCDIERALRPTVDDSLNFGHTVSNGSFSKMVGPGIRTGWVEATPAFAYGLSQTGSTRSGGSPSQLAAVLACKLLSSGALDSHLANITRPRLRRRHHVMTQALQALREHRADLSISGLGAHNYGGYFVWVRLPERFDSSALADYARKHQNLIVGQGALFEVCGDEASAPFNHHIRLSFSWESEENIVEGVARLLDVLCTYDQGAGASLQGSAAQSQQDRVQNRFK